MVVKRKELFDAWAKDALSEIGSGTHAVPLRLANASLLSDVFGNAPPVAIPFESPSARGVSRATMGL